ncbi:MAG: phosphodiester glycosidase family protein [Clostridia bacterium]|nr:phosphodiester glycosidase family protein [Clostridia bacterium]
MVGINDEEEFQSEHLKENSFEARRMRNLYDFSATLNEYDEEYVRSTNRKVAPQGPIDFNEPPRTQRANRTGTEATRQRPAPPEMRRAEMRGEAPAHRSSTSSSARAQRTSSGSARNSSQRTPVKYNSVSLLEARRQREKEERTSKIIKVLTAVIISLTLFVSMYAVMVFGNIPFVTKWRNIWIETAMTTDQHKWLATTFFPKALIEEIMGAQVDVTDIGKTDINKTEEEDILGQKHLTVGEPDSHGNEVLVNDIEQGIVILKVTTSNYVGRLVLIDDPSRVYIEATDYKNSRGEFICDYLEEENAIVGMNASGFSDPGGTSVGGVVTAQTIAQGEYWGEYSSKYITVGFDTDNRLIVGEFSDWDNYNLRDAFQYHPALIINGDKVIEGSSGWGLQPRSVIGQAENGVVMFFVVDGRQVGYSLGATMGDCADVLEEYGAVNAGACDGGSSSVLAYDGEILNEPSTNMPTGRYLPNAWVVSRKTVE